MKSPRPPLLRIRDKDQYNFTDPQSRIMKNSGNLGFDQHYNAQIAVDQKALLIVSHSLSNHPNDQLDALPTIDAINPRVGSAKRAALDAGYFSISNIEGLQSRQIDPYIATGRQAHDSYWKTQMAQMSEAPAENATPKLKMRYKLKTEDGKKSRSILGKLHVIQPPLAEILVESVYSSFIPFD